MKKGTKGGAFLLKLQLSFAPTLTDWFYSDTFKVNLNEEVVWLQCGSSSGQNNETIHTCCRLLFLKEFGRTYGSCCRTE